MFEQPADDGAVLVERLRETERQIAGLQSEQLQLMERLYRRAPDWIPAGADTSGLGGCR